MVMYSAQTDEAVLAFFGKRMAAFRIRNNWTQADLAQKAGVGKGTVERIERGESVQVLNLVKVLRACGTLDVFLNIFPDDSPSPMQLLYMGKMKTRRRARTSRKRVGDVNMVSDNSVDYLVGKDAVDENGQARKNAWVWDEDK
ncbi:MAG: helix-turn-helix transcriptional regulator [Fibrobacter sp.]|nr:helix-turn-helix transcriptional regulator [Fibrobacter sp.]